jgi:hypothetical protein
MLTFFITVSSYRDAKKAIDATQQVTSENIAKPMPEPNTENPLPIS